jgi:thiamine-phosphate pyrophosphorylase
LTADARPNRCRLIVIAPPGNASPQLLEEALAAGDVASVVLAAGELDTHGFQRHCEKLVPLVQNHGAAALISDDTQIMGRVNADGVLLGTPGNGFRDVVARFSPQRIVGLGGARERHRALELGEANPDFLFFGKSDGDIRPEPHPKNLALAQWWAEMVEIPCVVMAGSSLASVVECAATGADFAAVSLAVFSHVDGPGAAIAQANALLDEHAPLFGTA